MVRVVSGVGGRGQSQQRESCARMVTHGLPFVSVCVCVCMCCL